MNSVHIPTLVVLLGNARGGEKTWQTMYANLLEPLQADLALMFGFSKEKKSSLYAHAKYIWETEERDDWGEYYTERCQTDHWLKLASQFKDDGIMGGLKGLPGSGAIIFALRDMLLDKKHILAKYERIILSRSDFYYVKPHPELPNEYIWIVEGEDYGGITDRHHIFPTSLMNDLLGTISYIDSETLLEDIRARNHFNPEIFLLSMLRFHGCDQLIRRFERVQFTVATKHDTTRWRHGRMRIPGEDDLLVKYPEEYYAALGITPSLTRKFINSIREKFMRNLLGVAGISYH